MVRAVVLRPCNVCMYIPAGVATCVPKYSSGQAAIGGKGGSVRSACIIKEKELPEKTQD